ncbi:MAG: 50S ribosomal protein L18 [Mycoplasmataceae bacterium]|jgi:large subunit ribosomal protein L18|nr:50S ribosomal protein L18 [Mycoplasmataceae bacterium]
MKKISIDRAYRKSLRHTRLLNKLKREGNTKPRFIVSKSNTNIFAQIFDDNTNKVLASSNSVQLKKSANISVAKEIGQKIAVAALAQGIKEVVFDRTGNKFHGRIKAVADAAREKGLVF